MIRKFRQHRVGGVALVVTLVFLVLLAGMAVALLSTTGLERGTSKGVAEKAKSDLAAQSAVNAAISRLVDNLNTYPDSATSWERVYQSGSTTNLQYQGTTLYYREQTPEQTAPSASSPNTTPSPLHMLPLISGAQAIQIWPLVGGGTVDDKKRSSIPALDDTNSFDLNRARFSGDTQGAIGAPTGSTARPEFRGQWIDLTDSSGKVTGRYAYWIEDESFKVNANDARNVLRGSTTLGVNASEIPLQGLLKLVGNNDPDGAANSAISFRDKFPSSVFFEYRALNQVSGQPTLGETAKFEATVFSGASNLTRSGGKKVNLNAIVTTSTDPTAIRTQMDEIIKAISYHLPNFGQRFYRTGSDKNSLDVADVSGQWHRTTYLNKIAANIRDYIDSDSEPTIINNDGDPGASPVKPFSVRIGPAPSGGTWTTPPTNALGAQGGGNSGSNEVIAIGKDAVPFLQEYLLRVKQIVFDNRLGAFANYKIEIDHYLEFWNMTNKDIPYTALGPNAFLRIANQFGWDAGGLDDIPAGASRDFSIPLSQFQNANGETLVFRAGAATVLTTDPSALPNTFPNIATANLFRPPAGTPPDTVRIYQGRTQKKSGSQLRLSSIIRPSNTATGTDAETEVMLGNDDGMLESFAGLSVPAISVNVDLNTPADNKFDTTKWHFRASSLKGNAVAPAVSETGDPRTNNEQLTLAALNSQGADQTPYWSEGTSSTNPPGNSTLTQLNTPYVDSTIWVDRADNIASAANAPAPNVPNSALASIGQLGNIFDAIRLATSIADIQYSRGGGRTLKIGQPDRYDAATNPNGVWDGNSNSASREWAAWRLTDIFSTTSALQLDGRININGLNRDGGAALKTALYGYTFQPTPDSDPSLSGKPFDADPTDPNDKVNELIKQLQARLNNDGNTSTYGGQFGTTVGPLAERGELSELPLFNTGSNLATDVNTNTVYDRGREELFRRLVELITTRGNIFTAYVVGQSLAPQQSGAPSIVTSTSQLKVTFRIDPVWSGAQPTEPFDPTSAARFQKPSRYAVKILYAGE